MHELAITQGILKVVLDTAQQAGAERVLAIHLVIGELSGFVDESVQFYFDHFSQDTPAAGAVLHFRREAAQATCHECGQQFAVRPPLLATCPACDSLALQVRGGQELSIESIEVTEVNDADDTSCQTDTQRE